MTTIKVHKVDLDDVLTNTDKYNVSNLMPAENYSDVLSWSNTKNWVHPFHEHSGLEVIKVTNKADLRWIGEALDIGHVSKRFSRLHLDELDDFCSRYAYFDNLIKQGVFVRTEHVSLKSGVHGIGPYTSIRQIMESICTCTKTHSAFRKTDLKMVIYILPWLPVNQEKEFRVFVHGNKITAISVQQIYKPNKWLDSLDDCQLVSLAEAINDFFTRKFIGIWLTTEMSRKTSNFTMDLALLDNGEFYFIEANPFGPQFAAGSALFHWLTDQVLYNSDGVIEFRTIKKQLNTLTTNQ